MFSSLVQELLTDTGYWMKSGGKSEWRDRYTVATDSLTYTKCSECEHCKEANKGLLLTVQALEEELVAEMPAGAAEFFEMMNRLDVSDFRETKSGDSYGSSNQYQCVVMDKGTGRMGVITMDCTAMNNRNPDDAIYLLDNGYAPDGSEPWLTKEGLEKRAEFSEYYWGSDAKKVPSL